MSSPIETSSNHETVHRQQALSTASIETVSHSLLSAAKDVRYMKQFHELLMETIQSIKMSVSSRSEAMIKRSSMLLSAFLYVLIVVLPSRRTLGMEVSGLKFKAHQGLVRKLLSTVVGWYVLDTIVDKLRVNDPSENQESLRGIDRMEMHQRLRRQMLERAQIHVESEIDGQSDPSQSPRHEVLDSPLQRLLVLARKTIVSVQHALEQTEGPHSLENQQQTVDSRSSLVTWLLRLHLAHYCISGGTYPTVIHRLLKLNHVSDGSTQISSKPETNRVVALLIGVQAAASISRWIINLSANSVANFLESQRAQSSTSTPKLEQSIFKNSALRFDSKSRSKSCCGICRLERKHAAASIHCGHVFCWNCLNQWISTVQEACPLCRRPCRAQDIIFLHNYEARSK